MSPKSKHNRRKIPARRNLPASDSSFMPAAMETSITNREIKPALPGSNFKAPVDSSPSYANVFNEMKWIGIVTGIVMVCLILSYIFFR
jgi:hypothetical protein